MRRAAKVDANHGQIVSGLRAIGCTVESLAAVGKGCPDLLVGYRSKNYLFELKDGSKSPSRRRFTTDQRAWHLAWRGQVALIETLDDAIRILTAP